MINKLAENISDELIKIRRYLHENPELSNDEYNTCNFIENYLNKLGIDNYRSAETGVVAVIRGKKANGKTILIRSDIDALPVYEKNNVSYVSKNNGVMHACGHDAHITCALGVCLLLKELDFDFSGNVKIVFQPAEETDGGAARMIEEGIMDNPKVDAAIALHVEPFCKVGTIQYRNGAIMASPDDFKIIIKGVGGHGACPEKCINPIYTASEIIKSIQTIVQDNFSDTSECVVSVCTINAGTSNNIIPDTVEITGTARSLNNKTRDKIENLLLKCTEEISEKNNCKNEFVFNRLYPPVVNDKSINDILIEAAHSIGAISEITEQESPSMTGDDFSYFSQIVPGSYFKLGVGNEKLSNPLHSPEFDIDENSLSIGAAVLTQAVLKFLER